ncbi:MAG: MFS transporter [Anaerolineae bacterium]|nr:MFS transporter [Anaerolineae bacterium]
MDTIVSTHALAVNRRPRRRERAGGTWGADVVLPLAALRDRFHYLRGNVLVLTLTRTLGNFGRRMAFPYASLYLLVLGGDPAQIGLVNSLMALGGLVLLPIAGYISDHAGRVKLSALAQLLSGLVYLLYVLAPRWEYVAVGAVLLGVGTLQTPAESALLADSLAPADRGKGTAAMNAIMSVPAMLAPLVGGLVLEALGADRGSRLLYAYLLLAYVAGGLIKLRYLEETTPHVGQQVRWAELPRILMATYRGLPALYRQANRSLRAIGGVIVLTIIANAIAGPFWVVYAVERVGLSPERWGLALLLEAVCLNLAYVPAGELVDRWGRSRCQRVGLALGLLSSASFIAARGFAVVLVSRLGAALAMALFIPANAALVADTVPRALRGRIMAAIGHGSVLLLSPGGGIGGPGLGFVSIVPVVLCSLGAGYLYDFRAAAPWVVVIVIFALALGLSFAWIRDSLQAEA